MTPANLRSDRFAIDRERLRLVLTERAERCRKAPDALSLRDFSFLDAGRALDRLVQQAHSAQALLEPPGRRLFVFALPEFEEVVIATSAPGLDQRSVIATRPIHVHELVGDPGLSRTGPDAIAIALDAACREANRLIALSAGDERIPRAA